MYVCVYVCMNVYKYESFCEYASSCAWERLSG